MLDSVLILYYLLVQSPRSCIHSSQHNGMQRRTDSMQRKGLMTITKRTEIGLDWLCTMRERNEGGDELQ